MGDVSLQYADLEVDGLTNFSHRRITLRTGMSGNQRRSALAHELVHLERGPESGQRNGDGTAACVAAQIEELLVEGTAGLRLVAPWVLAEIPSLTLLHGDAAVADCLGIDVGTLSALDQLLEAVGR